MTSYVCLNQTLLYSLKGTFSFSHLSFQIVFSTEESTANDDNNGQDKQSTTTTKTTSLLLLLCCISRFVYGHCVWVKKMNTKKMNRIHGNTCAIFAWLCLLLSGAANSLNHMMIMGTRLKFYINKCSKLERLSTLVHSFDRSIYINNMCTELRFYIYHFCFSNVSF